MQYATRNNAQLNELKKNAKVTKSALEHGEHNTIIDNYL